LDQFREAPSEVGALVLAAGGSEPVLDGKSLPKIAAVAGARAPLLLDFGVPPNADPEATKAAGITRVGMDDLIQAAQERRLSQLMRLAPVRAAIDERLNRLRSDLATRAIGRKLADLRSAFEQIAAEEAERALADELSTLDAAQRDLLQRFASTVARRLAHLPLAGMRAAAAHASADAVDAFFREAKLRRSTNGDTPGRWKPDPEAIDATGQPAAIFGGGRRAPETSNGHWRTDVDAPSVGRQVRRAVEPSDAGAVVAHATPIRTSWAKD
jgi:glutamyl-tRNA reductase